MVREEFKYALKAIKDYSSFKLKKFTQNPKAELKKLWVELDSGTK